MTTLTIERVSDQVREWQSPDGKLDLRYITVFFEGGMKGSVSTKPDSVEKRLGQLKALIGKPGEFVLEGEKIRDFPGKSPTGGFGGGGGKGWQPRSVEERAEIMSMNMLTAATALCQNEWSAIRFDRAIEMVTEGMTRLLTYTRGTLKASGTEGPSVTGKGATASSVPDDNVADPELQRGRTGVAASSEPVDVEPAGAQSATTTSGASAPLDATPDRAGDGTAPRPQEPPSDDEPKRGAVSSRHVHEWKDAPLEGWVMCSVAGCGKALQHKDVEALA